MSRVWIFSILGLAGGGQEMRCHRAAWAHLTCKKSQQPHGHTARPSPECALCGRDRGDLVRFVVEVALDQVEVRDVVPAKATKRTWQMTI